MATPKKPTGKRQVARLTKKQLGFEIGRNVLNQLSTIANGVRDLVEKGRSIDSRTGQLMTLDCAPDDIKRSWSTEQLIAVEDFISVWSIEPEPAPAPPAPPKPPRAPRAKKTAPAAPAAE